MGTIIYDENGVRKTSESLDNTVFGGKVDSDGSAINLPAGWSSAYSAPTYTITHNLGYSDGDAYAVVATAVNIGGHANAQIESQGANSFSLRIFNDENANITSPFNFVLSVV